jgi:hypothetical protein
MRYRFTSDYTVALGHLCRFHVGAAISGVKIGRIDNEEA